MGLESVESVDNEMSKAAWSKPLLQQLEMQNTAGMRENGQDNGQNASPGIGMEGMLVFS